MIINSVKFRKQKQNLVGNLFGEERCVIFRLQKEVLLSSELRRNQYIAVVMLWRGATILDREVDTVLGLTHFIEV